MSSELRIDFYPVGTLVRVVKVIEIPNEHERNEVKRLLIGSIFCIFKIDAKPRQYEGQVYRFHNSQCRRPFHWNELEFVKEDVVVLPRAGEFVRVFGSSEIHQVVSIHPVMVTYRRTNGCLTSGQVVDIVSNETVLQYEMQKQKDALTKRRDEMLEKATSALEEANKLQKRRDEMLEKATSAMEEANKLQEQLARLTTK